MATKSLADLSASAERAVRYAAAAAGCRSGPNPSPDAPVRVDDLLVGVLLARPEEHAGARVLLQHFGLTGRDVLPPDYPKLDATDLRHQIAAAGSVDPTLGPDTEQVLRTARSSGGGTAHLRHVLGALLAMDTPLRWEAALSSRAAARTTVQASYESWLAASHPIGTGLEKWLVDHNPRHPVDLPVYAPDRINAEHDLVGIQAEADAFAYLIASCDLRPPLAIGLFGDWGSGKSFLMRAVDQRLGHLKRLVRDEDQGDVRVWKNTVRIEFNAWEYVQGNLWAGLLERIFAELGALQPTLVQSWRSPVTQELAQRDQSVTEVDARVKQAEDERRQRHDEVTQASAAVDRARDAAGRREPSAEAEGARDQARQALRAMLGRFPVLLLSRSNRDPLQVLTEAGDDLAARPALLGPYWRNPRHVLLATAGAVLIPVVAFLLARFGASPVVSALGGLAATVPVAASLFASATQWADRWRTGLQERQAAIRAKIQEPVEQAQSLLDAARDRLLSAENRLSAAEQELRTERGRHDELLRQLADLTPGRIFSEFATSRSTTYGKHLGLLAQVRQDLTTVEGQIADHNALLQSSPPAAADPTAPGAGPNSRWCDVPNRIVLYIDDLDRCSPEKVLEVLEAVHLLLSFEMFVVLVAVDSRWLTSALTDRLVALKPGQTSGEQPTPKDYLEKIFQLPFWVQPLPPDGRARLIHGLLKDSVRDPTAGSRPSQHGSLVLGQPEEDALKAMLVHHGTEVRLDTSPLVLDADDLDFFEALAPLLGDTPRRVKRFVNTCQLLFAMAPPLPKYGNPKARSVVSLVTGISEGLPCVGGRLLAELSAVTRPGPLGPDLEQRRQTTLGAFLAHQTGAPEDERERLARWLDQHPGWKDVRLADLGLRLDMIRRLRFDKPVREDLPRL